MTEKRLSNIRPADMKKLACLRDVASVGSTNGGEYNKNMTNKSKKVRGCGICGSEREANSAKGLCHKHYERYRRAKERLPGHRRRLAEMLEVVEFVEGKKELDIDVSGHPNYKP